MNTYQKAGVFIVRLVGYGMALLGALGVVYIWVASFANFERFTSAPRGELLTSVPPCVSVVVARLWGSRGAPAKAKPW